MTPLQMQYLLDHLPEVELRRVWPIVSLEAAVKNAVGGKPDPSDQSSGLDASRAYSPVELLPWYARPDWVERIESGIPSDAAEDFMQHRHLLPAWALGIAPLDAIQRAMPRR